MDASSPPTGLLWRIHLFDGPLVEDAYGNVTRKFRSRKVGGLLAYLALNIGRPCPREEIYEALWPEDDSDATPNRMRVALASLRKQLEPDGVEYGAVLDVGEPGRVRLRSEAAWCDTQAFDAAWNSGNATAAASIKGNKSLLPGYYDEWVIEARNRFDLLVEDIELPATPSIPNTVWDAVTVSDAAEIPPRLPLYLTKFFGRDSEKRQLLELVDSHRLVTLTGTGGIGKTRLAVETVASFIGATAFVPIAEAEDAEQVAVAALSALNVSAQPEADTLEQLIGVLRTRFIRLLVLDNAEHMISTVAHVCTRLLESVPQLHVLVTSRQHVEIAGEMVLPLSPLEPPPHTAMPNRLIEFPAVALFLDRARAIRPDLSFASRSAEAVVEICQRLEGIPLAIELAAGRITGETPIQIAETLRESLIDLRSRNRGMTERHRSLRTAIQGSVDLLSPELRRFFAILSVFHGGWTAEAAMDISGCADTDDYLQELVTRSLIRADTYVDAGAMRFSFLAPLRQFASEILGPTDTQIYHEKHRAFFLARASSIWDDDVRPYLLLDGEQENMLAALTIGDKDALYWRGLIGFLLHAWSRGNHRIALKWLEDALAEAPTLNNPFMRFAIRHAAGHILPDLGRFDEMLQVCEDMERDSDLTGEPFGRVYALATRSYVANHTCDYRKAMELGQEALALARSFDNGELILKCLSMSVAALNDYGRSVGRQSQEGISLQLLAEEYCREMIEVMPPYSRLRSTTYLMLSNTLNDTERYDEAFTAVKQAQRLAFQDQKYVCLMFSFFTEAVIVERTGMLERCAMLLGSFYGLQERMAYDLAEQTEAVYGLHGRLAERLGSEAFESLMRQGRHTSFEELAGEQQSKQSSNDYDNLHSNR